MTRCWCGAPRPYFAPVEGGCAGTGHLYCRCGGDFCVCHNHGEVECYGCDDCERDENMADDFEEDDPRFTEVVA